MASGRIKSTEGAGRRSPHSAGLVLEEREKPFGSPPHSDAFDGKDRFEAHVRIPILQQPGEFARDRATLRRSERTEDVSSDPRGRVAKEGREKEIITEINDDILAYQTKYGNLLFVVYDVGFIRDIDRFIDSFEKSTNVIVRVVKH